MAKALFKSSTTPFTTVDKLIAMYLKNPNMLDIIEDEYEDGFKFDYINQPEVEQNDSDYDDANRVLAQSIFELSQQLVPVDTGALKASGSLSEDEEGNFNIHYKMPYAIFVHEVLWRHHASPTQAKFLEDAAFKFLELSQARDPIYNQEGKLVKPFTFSMELGVDDGITLHLNSVSEESFENWIKEQNYNPLLEDF